MQALPIDPLLPELCARLSERRCAVLEAPPGAGKTTRVPMALLEAGLAGDGEVLVAEPRRLAARMAAHRVASERGERLGERVGYRVRFEEVAGPRTRLFYVTEGVLLRRLLVDPKLSGVGTVVLDEFHERHLETDLLLSLLAELKKTTRPELSLLVMSATLDAEPVAAFLGDCPRLRSEGRMFPVEIEHLTEPDQRPLEKQVVSAVRRLLDLEPAGHVLVFLPGAGEIRRAQAALAPLASERRLCVVPLHGDLPIAEQARAIEPSRERKVVLSTNVAESSVTIDGVTGVVDSGLARVAEHSPWTGLPSLVTAKVSRSSAVQRAGRAGRTAPGRVLRLYTKGDFLARVEHDAPELLRADLAEALLTLHGAGIAAPDALAWLSPPPPARVAAAEELLSMLGALDEKRGLTEVGRRMLELPLHPRLARVLVEGTRRGVGETAALIAALLGERDLRLSSRTDFGGGRSAADTATGPSDVLELVDAFELARSLDFQPQRLRSHGLEPRSVEAVGRAARQLSRLIRRQPSQGPDDGDTERALLIAVLTGFADRVARRRKPQGLELILSNGKSARLSASSVVRNEELLVAVDVEERSGRNAASEGAVRLASAIRADWLLELYPDRIQLTDELGWNAQAERVENSSRMAYGAVVLEESRSASRPSPQASAVLAAAVVDFGAQEFLKSDALGLLRERLLLVAQHYPSSGVSPLDENSLKARVLALCEGAVSFAELRVLDVAATLAANLSSAERRLLDEAVPERVRLPGGRSVEVHYEPGKPPFIESRLQDFFGMADGPKLCGGRLPVTLHLLAPNARAVQVTSDLAGFWQRHYPAIRRELMRRYPRHSWPEDGRHAEPPPPRAPRRS
jgi:ATP-dependent helicase HrpB